MGNGAGVRMSSAGVKWKKTRNEKSPATGEGDWAMGGKWAMVGSVLLPWWECSVAGATSLARNARQVLL
jgi:hypothetical protein